MGKYVFTVLFIFIFSSSLANNRSNQMNPNNPAYSSSRGTPNNHRSNLNNPNNSAYRNNYNNRSNQMNPNNSAYSSSRSNTDKSAYKNTYRNNSNHSSAIGASNNNEELFNSLNQSYLHAVDLFNKKQYKKSFRLFNNLDILSNTDFSEKANIQNYLGWMYETGNGVAKNTELAFHLYNKSAIKGNSLALLNTARLYALKKKYKSSIKYYTIGAKHGLSDAQYKLGIFYTKGLGVEKNPKEALKWFEKAGGKGQYQSQVIAGLSYCDGVGNVLKDLSKCATWLRIASQNSENDLTKNKTNSDIIISYWNKYELWKYNK